MRCPAIVMCNPDGMGMRPLRRNWSPKRTRRRRNRSAQGSLGYGSAPGALPLYVNPCGGVLRAAPGWTTGRRVRRQLKLVVDDN